MILDETPSLVALLAIVLGITVLAIVLVVFVLVSIDNLVSKKAEADFVRNLKIYTAVYAAHSATNEKSKDSSPSSLISETVEWQEKKWIPLNRALMLIGAGYKPREITRTTYPEINFEHVEIILALKTEQYS